MSTPTPMPESQINLAARRVAQVAESSGGNYQLTFDAIKGALTEAFADLQAKLDDHTAASIHTCGPTCQRVECVLRRQLAEAVGERDHALAVIDIGQLNCDSVFNDLKRERDLAKINASLDREKAVKLRTQLAEEQAHADRLVQQLERIAIYDVPDAYEMIQVAKAALQAHALRRKPPEKAVG